MAREEREQNVRRSCSLGEAAFYTRVFVATKMWKHRDKLEKVKVTVCWQSMFLVFCLFFDTTEQKFQQCQSDTNPQPGARSENVDVHTPEDLGELGSRQDNGAALSTSRRVSGQRFSARRSWRKTQCRVSDTTWSKCFHRLSRLKPSSTEPPSENSSEDAAYFREVRSKL